MRFGRDDGVAAVELCQPVRFRLAFLLLLLAFPLGALETVTTTDGKRLHGQLEIEDLRLTTANGVVVLPRIALDELQREGETFTVTTKDGRTLEGEIELDEFQVATDVQTYAVPAGQLRHVDFDTYADVTELPNVRHLSCPIRLTLPAASLLLAGKGHTTQTGRVRCGDSYIVSLELTTRKAKRTTTQGERLKGKTVTLRPMVIFGKGHDYYASLQIALFDGDRALGGDVVAKVFDEGEGARPGPLQFWVADREIEQAEDLRFRVQFLIVDENEDRGRGNVFWWFTQRGVRGR